MPEEQVDWTRPTQKVPITHNGIRQDPNTLPEPEIEEQGPPAFTVEQAAWTRKLATRHNNLMSDGLPTKDFKIKYDKSTVKPPSMSERNSDIYTIVDKNGSIHKSNDPCRLIIEYIPDLVQETIADLREQDNWTSLTDSPLMEAADAIKTRDDLEAIGVKVRLENPNSQRGLSDEDIIKRRINNLQKAHERNASPEVIEKAKKAADYYENLMRQPTTGGMGDWRTKVFNTVGKVQDEEFIKQASGETLPPVAQPIKTVGLTEDCDSSRFDELIDKLENDLDNNDKGDILIE